MIALLFIFSVLSPWKPYWNGPEWTAQKAGQEAVRFKEIISSVTPEFIRRDDALPPEPRSDRQRENDIFATIDNLKPVWPYDWLDPA